MKKLGVVLLGGIGVFAAFDCSSQSTAETALLFSRTSPGGSARVQGMGGTQVSLGGDFSSASSNPAGLGMFNRSEFTISPAFSLVNNQATYFGDTTNKVKSKLGIPAMSYAINMGRERGKFLGGTVAFSLTRLNDFNSTVNYIGTNSYNSIADYLSIDSDGINPQDLEIGGSYHNSLNGLGYNNYIIEPDQNLYYFSVIGINPGDLTDVPQMTQQEEIKTTGYQNQWSVSYGANLDDKYFFGGGIHLRTIRFQNVKTYSESGYYFEKAPNFDPLDNLLLEESLNISGSGLSATLGVIARPIDGLQVGVAYNTPTSYRLRDIYNATMYTTWNTFDYYGDGTKILDDQYDYTDEVISDYKLKTPGRVTAGATYFFGKNGFVSTELDVIDYSKAKYTSKTFGVPYDSDNDQIAGLYKNTVNFRIGGEFRLKDFRFRGGLGSQGEPFNEKQNNISRKIYNYTVGVGYRRPKFYLDAALGIKYGNNSYRPYSVPGNNSPLVSINALGTSLLFTVGFPF